MDVGKAVAHWVVTTSWILAVLWLGKGLQVLRGLARLTDLVTLDKDSLPMLPPGDGPHLTVLVPACNEEGSIEATLRSLLGSSGLRLQIFAIDDRSTDRTGERMDAMVAQAAKSGPHMLEVIHIKALPESWLGKPHALRLGVDRATAPWLLMTDADVTFAPDALERAMRVALLKRADHLVVLPTLTRRGYAESGMECTLEALSGWSVRLWKVEDHQARDFFGVGGCTLVRRDVVAAVGGMERLRMEVVEDVGLGWLVKRGGYRSAITCGLGMVKIRWIEGYFGAVNNFEKNGFAGLRFSLGLLAVVCMGFTLDAVVPIAGVFGGPWGVAAGLMNYAGIALCVQANKRITGISPWAAVMFGPSAVVFAWALARSAVLTLLRGGVVWRGTHYPILELRRGCLKWYGRD